MKYDATTLEGLKSYYYHFEYITEKVCHNIGKNVLNYSEVVMLPFGMWAIIIAVAVGLTVALLAKGYGHRASDWFFRGVGLGCFSMAGFISDNPNYAMISTFGGILGLAGFTVFFKITKPKGDAN
ncbi:MAG: hypothetical protein AB7F25_02745 [Deferribacterales bacterium]